MTTVESGTVDIGVVTMVEVAQNPRWNDGGKTVDGMATVTVNGSEWWVLQYWYTLRYRYTLQYRYMLRQ